MATQIAAAPAEFSAQDMRERALVYRTLGRFYLDALSQDELDEMDEQAFRELSEGSATELAREGYDDMFRFLRRRNTATCQDLRADFTQTFLGVREYEGVSAVPHESNYLAIDGEGLAAVRLAVLRTYKAQRIVLDPEIDLPEDHLAFEMEFMAVLSERCAEALEAGDAQEAARQLGEQARFLEEHIMQWFGRFYNLAGKVAETRFYHGVLKVTKAFLEEDRALLAAVGIPAV